MLDRLQTGCLLTICLTDFYGIALAANISDEKSAEIQGVVLTILNVLVIALPLFEVSTVFKGTFDKLKHLCNCCKSASGVFSFLSQRSQASQNTTPVEVKGQIDKIQQPVGVGNDQSLGHQQPLQSDDTLGRPVSESMAQLGLHVSPEPSTGGSLTDLKMDTQGKEGLPELAFS